MLRCHSWANVSCVGLIGLTPITSVPASLSMTSRCGADAQMIAMMSVAAKNSRTICIGIGEDSPHFLFKYPPRS